MNTCRVKKCRFSTSHITSGHLCGKCKKFGHGDIECGNLKKISDLQKESVNDKITDVNQCTLIECEYRWSHNTFAHHCQKCGEREHCTSNCRSPHFVLQSQTNRCLNRNTERKVNQQESIFTRWADDSRSFANQIEKKKENKKYYVKCPTCRVYSTFETIQKVFVDAQCIVCMDDKAQVLLPMCKHLCICHKCCDKMNETSSISSSSSSFFPHNDEGSESMALEKFKTENDPIFTCIPVGMGCMFFYRRLAYGSPLERLFMHSDDWGQYSGGSRVAEHNSFITGYREI
jgi:hypothetical protein